MLIVLVFCVGVALAASAAAQLDSNAIMGFETTAGWTTTGSSVPPGFTVSSTPIRTQGNAAYAVANPPNLIKIFSQPVSSTATSLAGVGNPGAAFRLDIQIPVQQGNLNNAGFIQLLVTSPSRGLSKAAVAQVFFDGLPTGIYSTLRFPIPDAVSNALSGATFDDLTFEFDVSSPGRVTGTYLFDNLRVHSLPVSSSTPPPGYGLSVDLVVIGDNPDTATFDASAVQAPGDFTFTKPADTSSPRLQLDVGYDGTPSFTCLYDPDPSDSAKKHFLVTSCTSGTQAGDLVGASWARLAILNGNNTGKVRAQLARNPVGDLVGRGIIPPMPTFWGDFENCVPAPASAPTATPVTHSDSCASQAAQASQILTNYFDSVNPASLYDWIVTPRPEFARRHGDGSPHNNLNGPPPPHDPPFDQEGHMNPDGDWDAYWRLNGNLDTAAVPNTDRGTTHFEAALGAHAVIWGYDVDVLDVHAVLDTDTGQTYPSPTVPSSASGTVEMYVFGILTKSESAGAGSEIKVNVSEGNEVEIAKVQIWIFFVSLKSGYNLGLSATGGVTAAGPVLSLTPYASLNARVAGGVSIGVASGYVNANVNLIYVRTPVTLDAKWTADADPRACALTLNYSLNGKSQVSSGGGSIDLNAEFGYCPLCYTKSWNIGNWDPLSYTETVLFNYQANQDFMLPTSMCTTTLAVAIDSPAPNATLSASLPVKLAGHATGDLGGVSYCDFLKWTFTPGANASPNGVSPSTATGCAPQVTFSPPASGSSASWTINLNGSITFTDKFGRSITITATPASVPVSVAALAPGVYITQIVNTDDAIVYTIAQNQTSIDFFDYSRGATSPYTLHYLINGLISGISGLSTFSASNGAISTTGSISSTPQGHWDITALPYTDSTGVTRYALPNTMITLTTVTTGGSTYTATLGVNFTGVQ